MNKKHLEVLKETLQVFIIFQGGSEHAEATLEEVEKELALIEQLREESILSDIEHEDE